MNLNYLNLNYEALCRTVCVWCAKHQFEAESGGAAVSERRLNATHRIHTPAGTREVACVAPCPEHRTEIDRLRALIHAAYDHVEELRDAWERGVISEHDGKGGTRSNRNYDIVVELGKAIG